jgi:8-oxo-dGTP diphosphatase
VKMKPDPNKRPAAGLVVIAPEERANKSLVLLLRRHRKLPYGGLWNLPGGRVEDGETPQEAAFREAWEEARFAVGPWNATPAPLWSMTLPLPGVAPYTYVGVAVPSPVIPTLNYESDAYKWVNPAQALKLPLHPGLREGLLLMIRIERGIIPASDLIAPVQAEA